MADGARSFLGRGEGMVVRWKLHGDVDDDGRLPHAPPDCLMVGCFFVESIVIYISIVKSKSRVDSDRVVPFRTVHGLHDNPFVPPPRLPPWSCGYGHA